MNNEGDTPADLAEDESIVDMIRQQIEKLGLWVCPCLWACVCVYVCVCVRVCVCVLVGVSVFVGVCVLLGVCLVDEWVCW